MVIGRVAIPMNPQKLKDEETARLFTREMAARNDDITKVDDVQKK